MSDKIYYAIGVLIGWVVIAFGFLFMTWPVWVALAAIKIIFF